jgi:drug/metabolite transporter (DMT)-like permease
VLIAALAALSAAALFAAATALQHRSAGMVTAAGRDRTAGVAGFVSQTMRHPLWLIGALADVGGLGLHALALRDGPLTLVQPLLVTGVVFALPLRQLLEHRRPRRDDAGWAAALATGLVLFLILSSPTGSARHTADPTPAWHSQGRPDC